MLSVQAEIKSGKYQPYKPAEKPSEKKLEEGEVTSIESPQGEHAHAHSVASDGPEGVSVELEDMK